MSKPAPITDALREEVIAAYVETIEGYPEEERPKVTMEVVNSIAQEFSLTPNSARVILTNAGVYILKKVEPKAAAASGGTGARVNKESAHKALVAALEAIGTEDVDMEVVTKLTGKAAQYLATCIQNGDFNK
ncbi:hypothetical protein [Aeromonas phage Akh-2]|nr:hypothetical protein [Aeromonas phage Akh-2]